MNSRQRLHLSHGGFLYAYWPLFLFRPYLRAGLYLCPSLTVSDRSRHILPRATLPLPTGSSLRPIAPEQLESRIAAKTATSIPAHRR